MPPRASIPKQTTSIVRDAVYGIAFVLLPAFLWYGSHDLFNLPRWVLTTAFLSIALPVAAFQKKSRIRLPASLLILCGCFIGWTILSGLTRNNSGDVVYLMGIRFTGLAMILWLSMQREVDRIVPFLVGLGLIEAVIGAGELLGLVTVNELLHVPMGTAGNNNIYGCLMALLLPFPLLLLPQKNLQNRILVIASALCIALLAMLSTSQTAVLAVLVAGISMVGLYLLKEKTSLFKPRRLRQLVLVLIPLLLVAAPIVWGGTNFNTGQFPTEETTGITERGMLWRESIDMCQEAPLLGCGPAGWKYEMLERGLTGYTTQYGLRFFTRPHNDFLWIAAESGLPAALIYISLLTFLFYFSVSRAWDSEDRKGRNRYYLLAAGILIWIIVSSLNFPLERIDHLVIFAAYVALIFSKSKLDWKGANGFGKAAAVLAAGICALLLVVSGQRFQQDRHLQEIELARKSGQFGKVLEECAQTTGRLYTVDYYTSTPIALYEGLALLQMGRKEEALKSLALAYEINPWHPHVLNNLASTYVMLGIHDEAEVYYRESIARFRDFPDPYVNLSRIMVARGDKSGAIELLNSFPSEAKSHKQAINRELQLVGS